MIVKIDKSFEKDLKKLGDKSLKNKVAVCIENVITAENISVVKNIKQLKDADNFFQNTNRGLQDRYYKQKPGNFIYKNFAPERNLSFFSLDISFTK